MRRGDAVEDAIGSSAALRSRVFVSVGAFLVCGFNEINRKSRALQHSPRHPAKCFYDIYSGDMGLLHPTQFVFVVEGNIMNPVDIIGYE
jgi:hypothetical protein